MKYRSKSKSMLAQTGSITLMGVGAIVAALFAFQLTMEYTKLKIVDRELDNYARSVAEVAIRSEMAVTIKGLQNGAMTATEAEHISNQVLLQVGYQAGDEESAATKVIYKAITYGNFASDGYFYELGDTSNPDYADFSAEKKAKYTGWATYKNNPSLKIKEMVVNDSVDYDDVPQFNAVAVQLWTDDDFYGYTPYGRALYGSEGDKQCYCDVRYESCVNGELTKAEILDGLRPSEPPGLVKGLLNGLLAAEPAPTPSLSEAEAEAIADAISVPNSTARKNYCEYGFTMDHPSDSNLTKYPYVDYFQRQGWIGLRPFTSSGNLGLLGELLAEENYSSDDYGRSLGQLPIYVYDGADTLANQAGLLTTVDELLVILNPETGSGSVFGENQTETNLKGSSSYIDGGSEYRCSLLTANVDVSVLGGLTDPLGLTNDALAAPCDSLLPQVGVVLNDLTDALTGAESDCSGLLGSILCAVGGIVGRVLDLVDPLLQPVLGLIGAENLESILDNLLDPNVVVSDPVYIGRSGTCVYGTDSANQSSGRCLYNSVDSAYQSCRYLLTPGADGKPNVGTDASPTLVDSLSIVLAGPVKDFPAAVESLNCEMSFFRFKQPAFRAGGWEEVN